MARLERIAERLELKEFQLRALLDVTKAINNNVDQAELIRLYENIVRDELGITRLTLYVNIDGWSRVLNYGTTGDMPEVNVEQEFGNYRDIQVIGSDNAGNLGAYDVAVPVYHQERPLAFLLIGDIDESEQRMSPTVKHLNFIQTLTNLIVVAVENRRLARQELQQVRDRRELELAADMQSLLIPRDLPDDQRLQAAGWYQPHSQVGGDYYDLFSIGEDVIVFCVADVSGKGIAASLLMSNFQASLRAMARNAELPLVELIHVLNERVYASARGERFITLFIGRLDLKSRVLEFANAGHNDPLLRSGNEIVALHDGSIALGMMPSLPFLRTGRTSVPPGSTLICYTDGLVEQEDDQGNSYETTPIHKLLKEQGGSDARDLLDRLRKDFEAHRGTSAYLDDIAVLVCKFR